MTTLLELPDGDVFYSTLVTFIPPQWGVVTGESIPIGTEVSSHSEQWFLGLANGACTTELPITFNMQNGSVDVSSTVSFEDLDHSNTADYADDTDLNGRFDGIDRYPDWLNRIFNDQQPIRRFVGITPVAGIPIILQELVFPPGTELSAEIPHDANIGFPLVRVLQNIGDPSPAPATPSIINDLCTPHSVLGEISGETAGHTQLFVNPGAGTYTFSLHILGNRDADGDGYENMLDTCPLVPNVGNPRIVLDGDADSDGLDQACDPNDSPGGGTNSDEDADGYLNRNDNCPLTSNGTAVSLAGNQTDIDLDQIGDACDPNPTQPDGERAAAEVSVEVIVGQGGGGPGLAPSPAQCPDCWRPGYRQGVVSCGSALSTIDVSLLLAFTAGAIGGSVPDCLTIDGEARGGYPWGDVTCNGNVDAIDALFLAAHLAGIEMSSVGQNCVPIGQAMPPA